MSVFVIKKTKIIYTYICLLKIKINILITNHTDNINYFKIILLHKK